MKRILKALGYSLSGLRATFMTEPAFRQELLLAIGLIPIALLLDVTVVESVLMVSAIILILLAELVNTAIEVIVDRISDQTHSLSKKAKDIGSAIVLVALLNALLIWVLILV